MQIARYRKHIFFTIATCSVIAISIFAWLNRDNTSSAADARNFNASNIMSDFVMTNKSSMSEAQIQAFLVSKNPCNDRNVGKASSYPHLQYNIKNGKFVCLAEESFDGESAARIIWQAAQDYNINPQVLIVLLEKEQGLITDTWPNHIQYRSATGYGCPDTADCDGKYFGFKNQVRNAANFFRAYQTGNTGWYKLVWPGNKYTGAWQPFDYSLQYHPNTGCGSISTRIENRATASLYSYTPYRPNQAALNAQSGAGDGCSSYGNRNFWMFFNNWFGSTTGITAERCDSNNADAACVWSARKTDGSQFLTTSKSEIESAVRNYQWLYEGVAFYASSRNSSSSGYVPVWRLLRNNYHHYTADQGEYNSLRAANGWTDEGIAFFAAPSTIKNNSVHKVNRLYNPAKDTYYLTGDSSRKTDLLKQGYVEDSSSFSSLSPAANLPHDSPNRDNIYELKGAAGYLYTTNLDELEQAMIQGYKYEGVVSTVSLAAEGVPVYRLQLGGRYLFTSSGDEMETAKTKFGYSYEGVSFFVDSSTGPIYRTANTNTGAYRYISDVNYLLQTVNTNSWKFEGPLSNIAMNNTPSPVYRFINKFNDRHFYTIDINEASRIANIGWLYETIAFNASKSQGSPVYRLLSHDKHFYTANKNERDTAVAKYGYVYEGIGFYVADPSVGRPAYRLQGGNDEYFYTISTDERDTAVAKYGYVYEGIGFYTP